MTTPFSAAVFAWQTAAVFTLRSLQLWVEPAKAQASLVEYAFEKQRAFAAGATKAALAAARGADPAAVMAAALGPARTRVRANHRALLAPPRPRKGR